MVEVRGPASPQFIVEGFTPGGVGHTGFASDLRTYGLGERAVRFLRSVAISVTSK